MIYLYLKHDKSVYRICFIVIYKYTISVYESNFSRILISQLRRYFWFKNSFYSMRRMI